MVNELIATVLTDNYIPPIILGEEITNGITRQWIIDGLQRSSSLSLFRYANTKITKNLDEYMVTYQRKILDGKSVCLQSRSYSFSLDGYFKQISGECADRNRNGNYNRYAMV